MHDEYNILEFAISFKLFLSSKNIDYDCNNKLLIFILLIRNCDNSATDTDGNYLLLNV